MKTKTTMVVVTLTFAAVTVLSGCASPKGSTGMEKRAYVQQMRNETLAKLYTIEPKTRNEIMTAPGYAVFDAVRTQIIITTTGNAYGLVHDNQTGQDIYMSAFSAGAGFGAGIKDYHAVIVFKDRAVMDEFVNKGWIFGASGTADAKSNTGGDTVSAAAMFDNRLNVYTFTNQGLMAGASLNGVKVWKDEKLN